MKFLHSISFAPAHAKGNVREGFGFNNLFDFALSLILSFQSLKKYHPNIPIEFWGDQEGVDFVQSIGLPYEQLNIIDDLGTGYENIWSLGKMQVFRLQDEAFLHFDNDFFLKGKLDDALLNADILTQNNDMGNGFNLPTTKQVIDLLQEEDTIVSIKNRIRNKQKLRAYNFGVFGGNNIEAIQNCFDEVFELVENLASPNVDWCMTVFLEQIYSAEYFALNNVEVSTVIPSNFANPNYGQLESEAPIIHLIGHAKKNEAILADLHKKVKTDYPAFYQKAKALYGKA